jgi:hypothetical protein
MRSYELDGGALNSEKEEFCAASSLLEPGQLAGMVRV